MKLRREASGFYRSLDLRFTAARRSRRKWIGVDKLNPRHHVEVKTLKNCRRWFEFAKACDPKMVSR